MTQTLQARLAAARRSVASGQSAIPRRSMSDDEAVPLSANQARLWFMAQLNPGSCAYNVPTVLRLRGRLDATALLESVRDVAQRHRVLRSIIVEHDGEARSVALPPTAIPVSIVDTADLDAALLAEAIRPFALDAETPLRAVLFRMAPEDHALALTYHHIATDAWSERLIIDAIGRRYQARTGQPDTNSDADVLQYADYVHWLESLDTTTQRTAVEWWADRLAGLPPMLDLPADRPVPAVPAWTAASLPVALTPDMTRRLRKTAAATGCTPVMVLLATWQALLGKICGTDDVAVGVPESGRHHPDTERAVGCFINTLVMRTDLSGDPTGRELLRQVRDVVLDAFAHAEAPFEQVVERINPERAVNRMPLVQVQLNVYDAPQAVQAFPGLRADLSYADLDNAKLDLNLALTDKGSTFSGLLDYRTELFEPGTAAKIVQWFHALLDGMLSDLDTPVGAIPLEPPGPLLAGPHRDYPLDLPLHTFIERQIDRCPDAVAVVAPDGTLNYTELESAANRLANRLRELGIGPDEPVGVLFEPSIHYACALLGIMKAGGAYLPLDATYPVDRISEILDMSQVRVVVTATPFESKVTGRQVLTLDDPATLAGAAGTRPQVEVGPDRLIHVISTSGSTGRPKSVAVAHRGVVNYLHALMEQLGDVAGGSFAVVSTLAADFGLTCVFGALTTGGAVHLVARDTAMDPAALAGYLAEHPIDVLKIVPSHLEMLSADGDLAAVLPRQMVIMTGEPCPWSLVDRIASARPDLRVQSHYGHTESTMVSFICETASVEPAQRTGVVPIGALLANVTGYLVDRAGRALPAGIPGELVITGPGVARGYVGRPAETAAQFVPDPIDGVLRCYRSGDRLQICPDGTVRFRGRVDDQVKVRGHRIEPGEIVIALRSLPSIAEAVVLPVGEGHTRKLAAWLVLRPGHGFDAGSVRAALRERLPDYMVPTSYQVLDRLPLNPNGKIDRAALPAATAEARAERVATSTPAEERVAAAFAEVLGVADVFAGDDFFALGGNSFDAVRAVRAIDPTLRVIELFTHPTVSELAAVLDRSVAPEPDRLLHRMNNGPTTATLVCVPYGGGSAAAFRPLAESLGQTCAVLAVELPGHDPARPAEALMPIGELVEALADEIERTVTGPVALYGHCVGTAVAVALARLLEGRGRQVLGVIAAGGFPAARLPGRLSAWANRVLGSDRWASDRLYRDTLRAAGGLPDDMDDAAAKVALASMRHDAWQARAWFTAELSAETRRLRAPILCLVGEQDRVTDLYQERYREWGAFAERVELATIPRAGHYFLRHQPDAVAAMVSVRLSDWAAGRLPEPVDASAVIGAEPRRGLRAFYTVAAGQFVSTVGNELSAFALGVWAYQGSGRVLDLALVVLLAHVPTFLLAPVGGALADRVDRRRIMFGCDLVSGLAMAALALLLAFGALNFTTVCVVVGVTAVAGAFREPAYLAAVAQLVPKPYLGQANAIANLGRGVGTVVAPLAGGALIALFGLPWVVAIDIISFAIGVVTLALVRFPDRLFRKREEPFRVAITGGWRFIARRRPLLMMIGYATVINYVNGVIWVATAPLVLSLADPATLGLIAAIGGIGAVLGAVIMVAWGGTRRRATGMIVFSVLTGVGTVVMGLFPAVATIAAGRGIRWAAIEIFNAHWLALMQVKVGPELQSRVLAVNLMLATALLPVGFLTAGPLAELLQPVADGPSLLGWLSGGSGMALLVILCGLVATVWSLLGFCSRSLRTLDTSLPDAIAAPEIDSDLDAVQAEADRAMAVARAG